MVQKGNLFRKKRKFGAVSAKQKLFIKVMAAVEKVDFISLAKKVAHSDMGRPWLNRNKEAPEGWPDQEGLRKRALELTLDQLKDENGPVDPVELTDLIGRISCRHDHETYIWATTAATVLLNILFNHDIPQQPFTSKDGRDLAHLDLLKSYQEKGLGVLYLANHSSHLDEFLVAGLLTNHGLKLPVFAAGQNMMAIKSLAKVLMLASYVVQRRGAGRHKLAALYNFCRAISDIGGQQGIFLEAWHGGGGPQPRRQPTLSPAAGNAKGRSGHGKGPGDPAGGAFLCRSARRPLPGRGQGAPLLGAGHGPCADLGPGPVASLVLLLARGQGPLPKGLRHHAQASAFERA